MRRIVSINSIALILILTFVSKGARAQVDIEPLQGVRFYEYWNKEARDGEYRKTVLFRCDGVDEAFCKSLCGTLKRCEIPENFCRSCAGTSSFLLMDFFKNVGSLYVGTNEAISAKHVSQFLKSGYFLSLSSRSVYNTWTAFDDPNLRVRLQSLCPESDLERPLVIFSVDLERNPVRPEFVLCSSPEQLRAFRVIKSFDATPPEDSNPLPSPILDTRG